MKQESFLFRPKCFCYGYFRSKEIKRVGGAETIPLDIRIIAATNRNLKERVTQNTFRENGTDGAATILGVSPSTLVNRMKKLGIAYGRRGAV